LPIEIVQPMLNSGYSGSISQRNLN